MGKPLSADQTQAQATLAQLILSAGLEAHAEKIARLTQPSIMLTTRKATRADLAVGASRLGGEPDLRTLAPWPEVDGAPIPFLAQIRLQDVTEHDGAGLLPATGLLSFFAKDMEHGHVRYEPDVSKLERRELPDAIEEYDRCFAWGFNVKGEVSVPPLSSPLAIADDAYSYLSFQLSDALGYGFNSHQMLGYREDPDQPAQLPGLELLIAINSDDNAGLNFGDAMRQYFYIPREDLRALDFSRVIVTAGV